MKIDLQIKKGVFRSPSSKKKLFQKDNFLQSDDGKEKYPIINNSICFTNYENIINESKDKSDMVNKYTSKTGFIEKIKLFFVNDYRNPKCTEGSSKIFDKDATDLIFISVGGGPHRHYKSLTNINIDLFNNVDIVADAHSLPYIDNSVDAIFCEAVLEHVKEPEKVVSEMFRVLKKDGMVHSFVPFLQGYHGYPHHYQNFTLSGHEYLYERNGFKIIESDTAVGPMYTITSSIASFLYYYITNKYISIFLRSIWFIVGGLLRPLDKIIIKNKNSHILSAATYVIAKKN